MSELTKAQSKKMQEWMDKLNIFDVAMLDDIVRYKLAKQREEIREELYFLIDHHKSYSGLEILKILKQYFLKQLKK
jgi:hypothetical protein